MSPPPPQPPDVVDDLQVATMAARLRIDEKPGPRKFLGVWLEHPDGKPRWIVDYRGRELWRGFDGKDVLVTGYCYQPFGQAIDAPHFWVETLRLGDHASVSGPYLAFDPERLLTGQFAERTFPPGSKRAGSTETVFETANATYAIAGIDSHDDPSPGTATVVARMLETNLAHAATTDGARLWISAIHAPGWTPAGKLARRRIPCPR